MRSFQVLNNKKQNWSSWIPTSHQPKTSETLPFPPALTESGIICSFSFETWLPKQSPRLIRNKVWNTALQSTMLCLMSSHINGTALKYKRDVGKAVLGFDPVSAHQQTCSQQQSETGNQRSIQLHRLFAHPTVKHMWRNQCIWTTLYYRAPFQQNIRSCPSDYIKHDPCNYTLGRKQLMRTAATEIRYTQSSQVTVAFCNRDLC